MSRAPATTDALAHVRRADRLARAASRWLRAEQPPGSAPLRPGPAHRELLAGLVSGLGARLEVDEAVQLLAAYSLALMEHERDAAADTPGRLAARGPLSPDYLEGLRIAERLVAALTAEGQSRRS